MVDITVEQTAQDVASRSFRLSVPLARVQAAEERTVRRFAQAARLPGFRPGRAPAAVVKSRFRDQIRQQVLEEAVREGWEVARDQHDLKPIADPSVRNLRFEDGAPLEFDLVVEVKPEVALGTLGGFALTREQPAVDDARVTEQLERLREQKAAWLPVEGEKPAPGQMVRVDVAAVTDEGVQAPQPYTLVLGQAGAVPGLEEAIMGLLPGATAEATVRYPDDHPDVARRGQTRRVQVTLHEVKRQDLPPLDDAFAREVGEFEDLAALRAAVRADLETEAARDADSRLRLQLLQRIAEANAVPAPDSLVHRVLHAMAHMYGLPEGELPRFEQELRPVAEQQVRRDLILGAVAEREGLFATEADVDARVAELARARNVPAGQLYASLQKAGRLGELERSITEERVFAHLFALSTVTPTTS